MFDTRQPYNDMPALPPEGKIETERVLKKLVDVRASLAALKEASKVLPDQSIVLQSMVLQEAKLSTEIESIFTTNDELYRQIDAELDSQSPAVKEVRHYKQALWQGYEYLKQSGRIDLDLVSLLGTAILDKDTGFRIGPGTRIGNRRTGNVVYTPPIGRDLIVKLLANLCQFLNEPSNLDPLTKIAVSHYQFEAIHPFVDGNGRTGRVLNVLAMVNAGILDLPVLYLSQEFLENRRDYYEGLRGVTETGEWEPWILFFFECLEVTAIITRRQFQLVQDSISEAKQLVRTELPKRFPGEAVDLVFSKPYIRISDLVDSGIAKRQSAAQYLKSLEAIGLLKSTRQWREVLYLNPKLMEILSLRPDAI